MINTNLKDVFSSDIVDHFRLIQLFLRTSFATDSVSQLTYIFGWRQHHLNSTIFSANWITNLCCSTWVCTVTNRELNIWKPSLCYIHHIITLLRNNDTPTYLDHINFIQPIIQFTMGIKNNKLL